MLKKILSFVLVLFMCTAHAVDVGEKAPEFTLQGSDGNSYSLSAYEGKIIYIFWFGYG